jgi:hypothetical protein
MGVRIKGSSVQAEVGADGSLQTSGAPIESNGGFVNVSAQNDDGTVTGVKYNKAIEVDEDYRLVTGQDQLLFNETFVGAAFNTGIWTQILTTMTATVTSGFATLNAGLSTAISAVAQLRTYRHFPIYKQATLRAEMEVQFAQLPVTGNVCEWGLFLATTTTAPTDGAFFRLNASGQFYGVVNYNGSEVQSAALNFSTLVGTNNTHTFLIYGNSASVTFWIDNILVAEIENPAGNGSATASNNLPIAFRTYNTSATASAQVMKVGMISVQVDGPIFQQPVGHWLSGMGGHATQGQTGGTIGSTAIYTNTAAAAAAALTNTTAAAANTGLGGIVNVLPTLTAGTDGILYSYQAPLGTAALPGKSLYVTGISLDSLVTTVFAGGPVYYAVGIAYGHNAVSLATTETATTKAPRRLTLGLQTFIITAPVGTVGQRLTDDYTVAPIVVQPGEFFQVVVRNLGTVTTTGAVTFICSVTGYWL